MVKQSSDMKGGRHGSGASAKNSKPSYMSHLSTNQLSTLVPHTNVTDSMTHENLMGCPNNKYRGV